MSKTVRAVDLMSAPRRNPRLLSRKQICPRGCVRDCKPDFVGPCGIREAHEYRYALQIQDILSRYLIFFSTVRNDAAIAAEAAFHDWVCLFSFSLKIQWDQGRHFSGQVFEEMCRLNRIGQRMGAVGHAQSQGQAEIQNQLLNHVRGLCNNSLDTWPQAIFRNQDAHSTA